MIKMFLSLPFLSIFFYSFYRIKIPCQQFLSKSFMNWCLSLCSLSCLLRFQMTSNSIWNRLFQFTTAILFALIYAPFQGFPIFPVCKPETWGAGCRQQCSINCVYRLCHPETGKCHGCPKTKTGDYCETSQSFIVSFF